MLNGPYGGCMHVARRCSYFTVLREPVERLISEYNYFCLRCSERRKFCGRLANTSCPRMKFLDWAAAHANQYTWHFSRQWSHGGFFDAYITGFSGYITGNTHAKLSGCLLHNNTATVHTALSYLMPASCI